jgi:hypothetical protein
VQLNIDKSPAGLPKVTLLGRKRAAAATAAPPHIHAAVFDLN